MREVGRSHRARPAPGTYKRMHEGVPPHANVALVDEPDDDDTPGIDIPEDDNELFANLPPDFALVGTMGYASRTLDEALRGPRAKEWQAAYDYENSQLEKLETWKFVNLPAGAKAIPHSIVFKEKLGPDGEVDTWRVRVLREGISKPMGWTTKRLSRQPQKCRPFA